MRTWRLIVLAAVILLPGVMLAPVWQLAGLGAGEDDILYYYPTRVFFGETIRSGALPWLNPWVGLTRPFAADPQTAIWYPFTWLFVALPPLQAYPLSLWLHYSLALWGMYRLLRAMRLTQPAALFGAMAFAFCGFMLAHRAHFAMQHAAAWTPWVLWRFQRYAQGAATPAGRSPGGGRMRLASAAGVLAAQAYAGHVQIAVLTALAALVFVLGTVAGEGKEHRARPRRRRGVFGTPSVWRGLGCWLVASVLAAGLFATQWVPTFDYLKLCTRVERTYADFVENSWHPVSAVGLAFPMLFGQRTPNFFSQPYWGPSHQVEQFAYAGILPVILAGLALRRGWRFDPRRRPWVMLGLIALLLALGDFAPLSPLVYRIPGSSLFRCPARAMLLVNLAIAALAAVTLHDLQVAPSPERVRLRAIISRWTRHIVFGPLLLAGVPLLLVVAAVPLLSGVSRANVTAALNPANPAVWVPLAAIGVSWLGLGLVVRRWKQPRLLWLLGAVTAADLGVVGWTIDVPAGVSSPTELVSPGPTADWMELVRQSPHRLWVVTGRQGRTPGEYVAPVNKAVANTNMLARVVTLTDYGPLQPRSIVSRFGFKPWGETDSAAELLSDTRWMRSYNVGWILLCDDGWPPPADCDLVATTAQGWRLYENTAAPGWAAFEDAAQPGAIRSGSATSAGLTVWADTWPQDGGDTGEAAPRVVISQLALPGWTIQLNGQPTPLESVDGRLIGVRLTRGAAVEIRGRYFPPGLLAGGAITLASAALLVAWGFWPAWRGAPRSA
jgi:hypothetical protein